MSKPLCPSVKRPTRAGRPTTPLITRAAASATALTLIDRDGLAALSLQAVARAMGVSAPSLYHHFRDKDALLADVARCLLDEIGRDRPDWPSDWEARVIALSLAVRRVTLRHPHAAPLALRFFPRQLMLPAYEAFAAACPYPPAQRMIALEAIEKFTYGSSLFAAAAVAQRIPAMPVIDAAHFPRLAEAKAAGPDDEAVFLEALQALLAGLRARLGVRT